MSGPLLLIRKHKERIRKILLSIRVFAFAIFNRKPDVIISFGISLGDDLLCSVLAKQLKKEERRVWIMTQFPDLFVNNPNVDKIILKGNDDKPNKLVSTYLKRLKIKVSHPWYTSYDKIYDQDRIPSKHILELMCDKVNTSCPAVLKPDFYLTEKEKKRGKFFDNQVCIHSTGKGARQHMKNKDWFFERFEEVVSSLNERYNVIQIGSESDELLKGVVDLRGKTSIRETASILYNSKFFIGQVGFLMHLARSVNCRSVIIYGGRERPDQTGYDTNINLYTSLRCSPCWYWNTCTFDKECMNRISVEDVLEGVEKIESRYSEVAFDYQRGLEEYK